MKAIFTFFVLAITLIINGTTHAQTFTVCATMNTDSVGSYPNEFLTIGNITYFIANDGMHGNELWKTDGTASGTVMVKDINPGSNNTGIFNMINFNGTLFFGVNEPIYGQELWKSDGTEAGTVVLKDIYAGVGVGYFAGPETMPLVIGNILYFKGSNAANGTELWKTDGTEAGTTMIKDIYLGANNSTPFSLTNVNGTLFFSASTASTGRELFKSDGTEAGTVLVKDIYPSSLPSSPLSLVSINGKLFFFAIDGTNFSIPSLYISDGTSSGTVSIKSFSGTVIINPAPNSIKAFNGAAYFQQNDGVNGYELWKSDGTTAGTNMLKDIRLGLNGSNPAITSSIIMGSQLYFTANDSLHGIELWKTDGTANGTVLVKDIFPGIYTSSSGSLVNFNGQLYFSADDSINGVELWKTDGTEAGTIIVKDFNIGIASSLSSGLTILNNKIIFRGTSGLSGLELCISDGTSVGTNLLKDIRIASNEILGNSITSSINNGLFISTVNANTNNTGLYFTGYDRKYGGELYFTNGTNSGTTLIKDVAPGVYTSQSGQYTNVNNLTFFSANDVAYGNELWKTDGTTNGTMMVKDINNGDNSSNPSNLTAINGLLYFSANNQTNGYGLWRTDGSTNGTTLLKSNYSFTGLSSFTNLNGNLLFSSNDFQINQGYSLWKSDGTVAGTTLVKSYPISNGIINQNIVGSFDLILYKPVVINNTMYFTASDGTTGYELWKTDGTTVGTILVKDIYNGTAASRPNNFTNLNGTLYFAATDATGVGLWKSDGTAAGTVLVKSGINPTNLTVGANNTLYFSATDATNGTELWKSNGTTGGTVVVTDVNVGNNSSNPYNLIKVGNFLYFYATAGSDYNVYRTDGSAANTIIVTQFLGNSNPGNIYLSGNYLYITASTLNGGYQLYSSNVSTILPLQLLHFSATKNTSNITCEWQTTNEFNTSYFNVQRSIDGLSFTTVGIQSASGVTNSTHSYNYNDVSASLLSTKRLYYRLQSVDKDGSHTFSNVAIVDLNSNSSNFSIAPNPATNFTVVSGKDIKTVKVIDTNGKILITQQVNQTNNSYLDISKLPKGSYLVETTDKLGNSNVQKLIKN